LDEAKLAENIEIIGSVSQAELISHYQNAKLFVFPSFHESFGFPPLEAMACGTPVIVSDKTALPEVCGDAAIYVDPHDITDIAQKIRMILNDESLQQKLIAKGLEHVKAFTWEKTAKEYLKTFKNIL